MQSSLMGAGENKSAADKGNVGSQKGQRTLGVAGQKGKGTIAIELNGQDICFGGLDRATSPPLEKNNYCLRYCSNQENYFLVLIYYFRQKPLPSRISSYRR